MRWCVRAAVLGSVIALINSVSWYWVSGFWNIPLAVGYTSLVLLGMVLVAKWKLDRRRSISLGQLLLATSLMAICFAGIRYGNTIEVRRRDRRVELESWMEKWGGHGGVSNRGDVQFITDQEEFDDDTLRRLVAEIARDKWTRLTVLGLLSPRMGDSSLEIVGRQPKLKQLLVDQRYFSPAALAAFAKRNPQCVVNGHAIVQPLEGKLSDDLQMPDDEGRRD